MLAVADGPYGGRQDLVLVRANGESFVAHTFGPERVDAGSFIFISGIEVRMAGPYLVAERSTDGTVILDPEGQLVLSTPDLEAARLYLEARGLRIESDEPPLRVEPGDPPTVVIEDAGGSRRLPLPDYRGEPYVNLEAVRGDWAVVSSYPADRTWRVQLSTGIIEPITKAVRHGLRQFGFEPSDRLYFTLDDQGGFLAPLTDGLTAGLYRSQDGAHDWVRLGRAAREIGAISGYGQQGTYLIVGSAGPDVTWPPLPPDQEPVLQGPFTQVERPSIGASYGIPDAAVALSTDGLCAAYLDPNGGAPRLTVLNLETGQRSNPSPSVRAGENLRFIPVRP